MSRPLPAGVAAALGAWLAVVGLHRTFELWLSRRNARRLAARGGIERSARHFPAIVAVHALFPLALAAEVVVLGARPGAAWPAWVLLLAAAEALRLAAMRALGERWNVRIWVVPGEPPVRRGIYRWLRHPNYLGVAIEFVAAPLAFGAWRTAVLFSALGLWTLTVRVRAEDRALEGRVPA